MKNKPYPLYAAKNLNNMIEVLNYAAKKYKSKTAFIYRGPNKTVVEKTFIDFSKDVKALGTYFLNNGMTKKHISVYAENSYEWVIIYFAAVGANNVIIPFDKELNALEIKDLIERSDSDYLFYSDYTKEVVTKAAAKSRLIDKININSKPFTKMLDTGYELLANGDSKFDKVNLNPDKLAVILFTSGTTGLPKGVMLTQKNITWNMIDCTKIFTFTDRLFLVLPLHHSFGITAGIMGPLYLGTAVILNKGLKDIPKDLVDFKPTETVFVPLFVEALYNKIWLGAKQQKKDKLLKVLIVVSDFLYSIGIDIRRKLFKSVLKPFGGELKYVISGAAPLDPRYAKAFRSFGIEVRQGYGITESSPVVSVNRPYYYRDASVGQLIPKMKVKIVNPDERGHGEIHLSGPHVMQGYYKNKKETNKVLKNGWFNTEDIGYMDKDGFLYIDGRIKNLIILSNGKNIAAEELEMKIGAIDIVKEVVVSGHGEKIKAEVFLDEEKTKKIKTTELKNMLNKKIDDLNKKLPIYKNITEVEIRDTEFPKTTTKKIKR